MFVVLDRDGTLINHVHYLTDYNQVVVIPEAIDALRLLNSANIPTVVITNQPVVAKGLMTRDSLDLLHLKLSQTFVQSGTKIGDFYVCPHQESDSCQCRKPKTLLLQQAALSLGQVPSSAFVCGDSVVDMELASGAGARGIHVRTGVTKQPLPGFPSFASLLEATKFVLATLNSEHHPLPNSSSVG